MIPEKLKNVVENTEGWLSPPETDLLYFLSSEKTKRIEGDIVEIGSWKGKSTILFGTILKGLGRGKVYAIDPHTGSEEHGKVWTYPDFKKNIDEAGISDVIVPIIKTSMEAVRQWNGAIRLLWIDGSHEYSNVKEDFISWSSYVVKGGVVAFHDTLSSPDVGRVIRDIFFSSNQFKNFRFVENIVSAEKTDRTTVGEKIGNLYTYCLWRIYGLYSYLYSKNIFRLPLSLKKSFRFIWKSKYET